MTIPILCFVAGLILGAMLGVLAVCLCVAGKTDDPPQADERQGDGR